MSMNKVFLLGNLTRDPQLSTLPSQTSVVEFGIATNRKWKDQGGQQREEVCFVDCKAFGKTAEVIQKFFTKGKPILVEGRLTLDQWEKDGVKHSKHRVVVESFTFVGGDRAEGQPSPQRPPVGQRHEPDPQPMDGGEEIPF